MWLNPTLLLFYSFNDVKVGERLEIKYENENK